MFTVEQHVRGKWACRLCRTLTQPPVPAQKIDKGIPTVGLLGHVTMARLADHLPLYRQERIFGRAGLPIPRSTRAQWVTQAGVQYQPLVDVLREEVLAQRALHAEETPMQMLAPGRKKSPGLCLGLLHHAVFGVKAVVYDCEPRRRVCA